MTGFRLLYRSGCRSKLAPRFLDLPELFNIQIDYGEVWVTFGKLIFAHRLNRAYANKFALEVVDFLNRLFVAHQLEVAQYILGSGV